MAYLALYRRYRPSTFDNLVGQEHIVKTLVNQITGDKLGHAYLFTGTRGTGKTSVAKIFSKAINCLSPINGSPCGQCDVCKALADPSNIDIMEIDAASNNGVNEIRDLREKVQYPPVSCKYKVYIIDEVHMLTGPAFNALLKTLEEPPKHAVFILATTEVHKIPATILSRCMRFDFRLISTDKIANLISSIYDEQGKQYEKEAVYAIAKAGEGSIRDALSIADIALSFNTGKLTYDDVMNILGSSNADNLVLFIKSVLDCDLGSILLIIDKLTSLGKSIGVLVKDVTALIRDLLVVSTCDNANDILALPAQKFNQYKEIALSTNQHRLIRILEIFSEVESSLKYSNQPRVIFETASIKASKPDNDYNVDALLSRIKTLEDKINGINVQNLAVQKVERVEDIKPNHTEEIKEQVNQIKEQKVEKVASTKPSIQSISIDELRGKLLTNLRKYSSGMVWTLLQSAQIEVAGNILVVTAKNENDQEFLDMSPNRFKIEQALDEFLPFELQIKLSDAEKSLDAVDLETERVKKIFGDDIVIIK